MNVINRLGETLTPLLLLFVGWWAVGELLADAQKFNGRVIAPNHSPDLLFAAAPGWTKAVFVTSFFGSTVPEYRVQRGRRFWLNFGIRNVGDISPALIPPVVLTVDGVRYKTVHQEDWRFTPTFPPGGAAEICVNVPLPDIGEGRHALVCIIDPDGEMDELNRVNNQYKFVLTVVGYNAAANWEFYN